MMATSRTTLCGDPAVEALGLELGVHDTWLLHTLRTYGVDQKSARLVPWLPAIELAWIDGLTSAERRRLLQLVHLRHPALADEAIALLTSWLSKRPAEGLFRTARRTLRSQLNALPPVERPALRARVVGPCVDIADVSGGVLGFGARSRAEDAWLQRLSIALRTSDERASHCRSLGG